MSDCSQARQSSTLLMHTNNTRAVEMYTCACALALSISQGDFIISLHKTNTLRRFVLFEHHHSHYTRLHSNVIATYFNLSTPLELTRIPSVQGADSIQSFTGCMSLIIHSCEFCLMSELTNVNMTYT